MNTNKINKFPNQLKKRLILRKSILFSLLIVLSIVTIPILKAAPYNYIQVQREGLRIGISNLKSDIDPNWESELVELALEFSKKLKVNPKEKINKSSVNKAAYLLAQIWVESHFIPFARSRSNAQGLMQIKPATARILAAGFSIPLRKSYYDVRENLELGVAHMNSMLSRFGSLEAAAYAYNIGSVPFSRGKKNDFYWKRIKEAYSILSVKL